MNATDREREKREVIETLGMLIEKTRAMEAEVKRILEEQTRRSEEQSSGE